MARLETLASYYYLLLRCFIYQPLALFSFFLKKFSSQFPLVEIFDFGRSKGVSAAGGVSVRILHASCYLPVLVVRNPK